MRITVKPWFYEQIQTKAGQYNFTLCWKGVWEKGDIIHAPEDRIGYYLWGEKIKETEKAVFFHLDYWNLNKGGRDIINTPIEHTWKAWIPKSVLL